MAQLLLQKMALFYITKRLLEKNFVDSVGAGDAFSAVAILWAIKQMGLQKDTHTCCCICCLYLHNHGCPPR